MSHNSIILSLIIVENVDPVTSASSFGNLLKMFQIKWKDFCNIKVKGLKCFSKLGCAFYQAVNLDRYKHDEYLHNYTKLLGLRKCEGCWGGKSVRFCI